MRRTAAFDTTTLVRGAESRRASLPNALLPGRKGHGRRNADEPQGTARGVRSLGWSSQPRDAGTAAESVSVEQGVHLAQPPPRRPVLGKDNGRHDAVNAPTEAGSLMSSQPRLGVQVTEQLLHIDHGCLDLDHEQGTRHRMPRQEIDTAALTVPAVADFNLDDPTPSLEAALDRRADPGVTGVQQPVEVGTVPEDAQVDSPTQRADDRLHHADRQLASAAALDKGHGRSTDAGTQRDRRLRETLSHAQSTDSPPESLRIHRTMFAMCAYGALTGRLSAQPPQ
jgi:hypothetical protein